MESPFIPQPSRKPVSPQKMRSHLKLKLLKLLKVVALLVVGLAAIGVVKHRKIGRNTLFSSKTDASSFSGISRGDTVKEVLDKLGPPLFFYYLKDGGYWYHSNGEMVEKYKQYECILHYSKPKGDGDYLRRELVLGNGVVIYKMAGWSG